MQFHSLDLNGNPVSFSSWTDFFNPTINNRWKHSRNDYWKVTDYIDTLNVWYSKENLTNYEIFRELMFNGNWPTHYEHQHFLTLTADLPDDMRWILSFVRRSGLIDFLGHTFRCPFTDYVYQKAPHVAVEYILQHKNDLSPAQFVDFIKSCYKSWNDKVLSDHQCVYWRTNAIPISNDFIHRMLKMMGGDNYCDGVSIGGNSAISICNYVREGWDIRIELLSNRLSRPQCVKLVSKTDRTAIHSLLSYSTDVLSLLPYPNKLKNEIDPVLVGVELETCTDYSVREVVDAADEPFFLAKTDSSISGTKRNCMELVTAPSSFKYLKRQYALWFNKLDYMKFDVTTRTSNGMHVHIGRKHFEDNIHIRNFCWFLNNPANTDFLLAISERGNLNDLQRWSPQYSWSPGMSRTRAFREVSNYISNIRGITNFKGGWEIAKTVEVRMFRAVVSYATIVKNLEFVEALFNFTEGLTSYRQLTLRGFLDWLDTTPRNRFTLLKKFIEQSFKKDKLLATADIKEITFALNEDEKILNAVKKSGIKLTQLHVSALNEGKRRTFIINKDTGELEIVIRNRGKLHMLDKSFADRYLRDQHRNIA